MIPGIDVSHWQGDVDWRRVRAAGVRFAWAKAAHASGGRDERWTEARRKSAADAGVALGGYIFADLSQSPERNAANLADAIGPARPGELIPALDVEAQGIPANMTPQQIVDWCKAFAAAFARPCALYTDHGTLLRMQGGKGLSALFPHLWLARYTGAADPGETGDWPRWSVWQWSQTGTVDGVDGKVDCNRCRDEDTLHALITPSPTLAAPGN